MNWNNLKTPFKALVILVIVGLSPSWRSLPRPAVNDPPRPRPAGRIAPAAAAYPTASVPTITSQVQAQTREVIDRRINGLGVAEPSISNVGTDRILVELPNVKNPDEAERVLKEVAVLEYKIVPLDVDAEGRSGEELARDARYEPSGKAKGRSAGVRRSCRVRRQRQGRLFGQAN